MKLNLDYYKEDIEYNNYENEGKIINEYIEKYEEENFNEIINQDTSVNEIKALSDIRKNIISWYPFKENCSILEIGAGLGEITGKLCEKSVNITSIEFSKRRGEAIQKRHHSRENLEVIIGNLKDIQLNEKFDYVVLIGILGYAKQLNISQDELIQFAKSQLKDNGIILLADDNRLGMKYWSELNEKEEYIINQKRNLFTLKEINQLLNKCELNNYKTYYVQPDILLTNVIFTDEYLPDGEDIGRNIFYGSNQDIEFYNQNEAYKQILKEKELYPIFANSFFIEVFSGNIIDNKIKMVSYSNIRKKEYRIKTIMKDEYVYKCNANNTSKKHIEQIKKNIDIINSSGLNTLDTYNEEEILSRYCDGKTLDKIIIELIEQGKLEEVINLINAFKDELISKLEVGNIEDNVFKKYNIEYEEESIEELHFIKYGLWDLIFQNCFYVNNKFYFYDQEWMEENIPLEFILFRTILYFGKIKKYITDNEMYEKLGINENQIELFKKLDNAIQNKIREENMWNIHTQKQNIVKFKEKILTMQHEKNLLDIDINEKENEIALLKQENENLNKQLQLILNSKSWKITEPIRRLGSKRRKSIK